MRFRHSFPLKKSGITIIESLVYVFLTTMILAQGISMFISLYKSYKESEKETIKYNRDQNFFVNLDSVISEGGYEKISVEDNNLLFFSTEKRVDPDKIVKSYDGKVAVRYMSVYGSGSVNVMIKDIDGLEIRKKGKLIYLIMRDKDGKEFIKCI